MQRLLIPALLALTCCACANKGVRHDARPIQVQAADTRSVFVRVMHGSPDAVVLESPSPFAPVLARLDLGQRLATMGERSGPYTWVRAHDTEGWVFTAALGRDLPRSGNSDVDQPSAVTVAQHMYPHEEFEDSPTIRQRLRWLEDYEKQLDTDPDSVRLRQRFIDFGRRGGLLNE